MSIKNVANSLVVLAAAFQGSSGAVLRGKSLEPSSPHGQGNALALAGGHNEASLEVKNVPGGMFHGGHRVPTAVLEIVRRASTAGVAVSEQELKELIADVQDVEQRLSALMKGQAAVLTSGGQASNGAAAGTGAQEGTATGVPDFVVSGAVPDQLTTGVANSANSLAATSTASVIQGVSNGLGASGSDLGKVVTSSVRAGASGCTFTITRTLTEYIVDDPTPLPVAEDVSAIVNGTSASENLSANLKAIPSGVDGTALLDMALASPGAPGASASLPSSAAALAAAPEATLPPAPAEVVAQEASSVAPSAEPAAAAVSAAPSGPGILTLAFPDDDASAIVWRTIALP
ncbi:DNA repair protein rhp51 [Verticillium dahliae VDG2]|nr:DNA repair protein rhp51 [Verticillium dahliae VDG2]